MKKEGDSYVFFPKNEPGTSYSSIRDRRLPRIGEVIRPGKFRIVRHDLEESASKKIADGIVAVNHRHAIARARRRNPNALNVRG